MRGDVREDIDEPYEGGGRVEISPPAAIAEIHHDARPREEDHERIGEPVQNDVDGSPLEASRGAHREDPRLVGAVALDETAAREVGDVSGPAEEDGEPGEEMPGKDLALRQDRSEPF